MPTYNGALYIRRQLESILCQIGIDDEIIISDDSSTDDTLLIVKSFHDERIRVFGGNTFHNPIYNLENALKKARGKYIFLSDQDDVWLPNKVDDMMNSLQENDLVISDCIVVDAHENTLSNSFFSIMHSGKGFCKNLVRNTYIGCCMAFRREVFNYVLPFPKKIPMHDSWIALSVDFHGGKIQFLKNPCLLYRRHTSNASSSSGPSEQTLIKRIRDRWNLLSSILKCASKKCSK